MPDPYQLDEVESWVLKLDPRRSRHRRRARARKNHIDPDIASLLDDPYRLDTWRCTYTPGRREAAWLSRCLSEFFASGVLADILFAVREGKEANVYAGRGGPPADHALVAVKVYRPRTLRHLRNDALYRAGRAVLDHRGRAIKANKHREHRALRNRTAYGKQVRQVSWMMHEFEAMQTLWQAGVTVPWPVAAGTDTVVMDFLGDEEGAAPVLERVDLGPAEGERVFAQVVADIEAMLECGLVHGDLSAHNLMYWDERAVMIDFPQVSSVFDNPNATMLFERDVHHTCRYFRRNGVDTPPWEDVADGIWERVFGSDVPLAAPASPPPPFVDQQD